MAKQSSARSTPPPRQPKPQALTADSKKLLNHMPGAHPARRIPSTRFFLRSGLLSRAAGQAKK